MFLDHFFSAAVPFTIFCLIAAKLVLGIDKQRGIYSNQDGQIRRDEINRKYRTNRGALVIVVIFGLLWSLALLDMLERWGPILFTFAVGTLILIPFMAVCMGAILVYLLIVHGIANRKASSSTLGS